MSRSNLFRLVLTAIPWLWGGPAFASDYHMATGSYAGNGAATQAVTSVGFQPDLVIISSSANRPSVARSSTMLGNATKRLGTADALKSGCILSLDANGFTVGSDNDVNQGTKTYYWVAFQAAPGVMVVGSYVGDGSDDRDISGLGLLPTYTIVMGETYTQAQHRTAEAALNACLQFDNTPEQGDRIQGFAPDVFQVGRNESVNKSTIRYHYVAWAATPGVVYSGSYQGNSTDDRNITDTGLAPALVMVRSQHGRGPAVCRSVSMPGDFTLAITGGPGFSNAIQSLRPDGFQVGTHTSVNAWPEPYYGVAFRGSPRADLGLAKTVDLPTPSEGDTVVYTITLVNYGPDSVSSCTVTDPLPSGLTFLSSSGTQGSFASGSEAWSVGELNAAASAVLTLRCRVNAGTGGTLVTNEASITASSLPDPNAANNTASASATVQNPGADLASTMSVDQPTPGIGQTVTYTITLANGGPDDAVGIVVTDLLPTGLTYASHAASQGAYDATPGLWSAGSLDAGASAVLTLSATVDEQADQSAVTNTASITSATPSDPVPANNTASAAITVQNPRADLALSMSVDRPTPSVGETVTFTVSLANQGPRTATGIVVADLLPPGLTYASHSAGQGSYEGGSGLWAVGTVSSGTVTALTISAIVGSGPGGSTITNTATITAASPLDPVTANNTASSSITLASADLALSLTADPNNPNEGGTVTFTLTVSNNGPSNGTGVTVTDLLPAGLTYLSHTASRGTYVAGSGLWTVGSVNAGSNAVLTLSARVNAGTRGTTISNAAGITAAGQSDPVAGNNAASIGITVQSADLALSMSVDRPTPDVGETVTFVVTLTNHGPSHATGVTVTDLVPSGLTYVVGSTSQGTYTGVGGLWSPGQINSGASAVLSLAATVNPGTDGSTIINTAAVTAADQADPVSGNNAAAVGVAVGGADIALAMTVSNPAPNEGESFTYAITLTNHGPNTVTGVQVTAPLPQGLSYVSQTASQGSYAPQTGAWTVGAMNNGAMVSLVLAVSVNPGTGGTSITGTAGIGGSDTSDPVSGNNSASFTVTIPSADLGLSMSVDQSDPEIGASVIFTLRVQNLGPDAATEIVVTDLLPAGVTFSSSSASQGAYQSGSGVWSIGSLAKGSSATLNLTATVDAGPVGSAITNTAAITACLTADPAAQNDAASARITVRAVTASVRITAEQAAGSSLHPGGARMAVFRLTAENRSSVTVTLQRLTLTNATTGPGTQTQLDEEWTPLRLSQIGEGASPMSATVSFQGGAAVFNGLSIAIEPGATATLEIEGGASIDARDGDLLDLKLTGPDGISFAEPVALSVVWPLSPQGSFPVDGMTTAQIGLVAVPTVEIFAGDSLQLALDLIVPANGYQDDVLEGVRLLNLGDAQPGRDISALQIWADGGDGVYGGGFPDDRRLGSATWTGNLWSLVGLSEPIPSRGLHLYATVSVSSAAVEGRTVRLSLPGAPMEGLLVRSGNDGPIDASLDNPGTLTILGAVDDVISVTAEPQNSRTLLPGGAPVEILRLHVVNFTREQERLQGLTLHNTSLGPGSRSALDAGWSSIALRGSVGGEEIPELFPGTVSFQDGRAVFAGLAVDLPPRQSIVFSFFAGASLTAREPDLLDVQVQGSDDLVLSRTVTVDGEWPINPAGSFVVDGMAAAQATLHPIGTGNFATSSVRNLVLDVTLPANGYEADSLTRFGIANLGTAVSGLDIVGMELWADNGDRGFEPGEDRLLGPMVNTGGRWEITGLSTPVPEGGLRVFATADVGDLATEGRTIRFSLPVSDDLAVGMASGNDGPRDQALEEPFTRIITSTDRLTVVAKDLPSRSVSPGERGVVVLQLIATNAYDTPQVLQEIALTNLAQGIGEEQDLDREYEVLALHRDGDEDGILDEDRIDPVLATGAFSGGRAVLSGFTWQVGAHESRHIFVTAAVSLRGARDGDLLGVALADPLDLFFQDDATMVGAWPLDSGARYRVDGMAAQQVVNLGSPAATLGPGQGPVPVLDLLIPSNGYTEDVLNRLALQNLGTAGTADIDRLELWRDGGDGVFSAAGGDDENLGRFAWSGGEWLSPSLNEPLQLAGARFYVSIRAAETLPEAVTVRLAVPVDGITVASQNDGPLTQPLLNAETVLLSPSPLLTSLSTYPSASTVGEAFSVRMIVENICDETVEEIEPSPLMAEGTARLSLLAGPDRPRLRLAPGERDTLVWSYTGETVGESRLSARAEGTGLDSRTRRGSLDSFSDSHGVFTAASNLEMFVAGSPPFTVSRGQHGVVPLSLTYRNPGGERSTSVKLTGIRIRLEDENGLGIVPSELLTGISVREGNRVYLAKAQPDLETTGAEIDLALTTPAIIAALEPATLSLSLDIFDQTMVRAFRVSILDQTWFRAEDVSSHAPVTILLQDNSYPLRSGLARLVEEASEVTVESVPTGPVRVEPGREAVPLLTFHLQNVGVEGISSDVRISGLAITLTDSLGEPLANPGNFLQKISVRTPFQSLVDLPLGDQTGYSLSLAFVNALTLPANVPIAVTVLGDIAPHAGIGRFRVRLDGSGAVGARDANTRLAVPVTYRSVPIEGGVVQIEEPAHRLAVRGEPAFPSVLTVGEHDVTALTVRLRHPGPTGAARILVDSLFVECRNEERSILPPGQYLARVKVMADEREVGAVTDPGAERKSLAIPLNGIVLEPGDSSLLRLVVNIDASAPASFLETVVGSGQIVAADANSGLRVEIEPDEGGEFPLVSGLAQLKPPPRELVIGLDSRLPVSIAADGREYPAALLSFANPAPDGSGVVRVARLRIRAADLQNAPIAIGSSVTRVTAFRDDAEIGRSDALTPDSTNATLVFDPPLAVESGATVTLELRFRTCERASASHLRLGCEESDIGIVQPEGALLTIQARPRAGQAFPLWSEATGFSESSLEESYANYPNPFAAGRQETVFIYYLPQNATVTMRIWTLHGESVAGLISNESQAAGLHQSVTWDGRNGRGSVVVNGVYVAELQARFVDGTSRRLLQKVAVVR